MVVSSEAASLILVDANPGGSHSPMDSGRFVRAAPFRWITASAFAPLPDGPLLIRICHPPDPTGGSSSAPAIPTHRGAYPCRQPPCQYHEGPILVSGRPPPPATRRPDPHQHRPWRIPDGSILISNDNTLVPTGRSLSARSMPYTRREDPDQPPPPPLTDGPIHISARRAVCPMGRSSASLAIH